MISDRDALVEHYAPLAKQAADRMLDALPACGRYLSLQEYEHLITAGMVGVIAGVEQWEQAPGLSQKEAVRLWVERCLLEYLASGCWVPRELEPIFGDKDGGERESQPESVTG